MIELPHYEDFSSAVEVALQLLKDQVGVSFWMATRVAGNDLMVLNTAGEGFTIKVGDALPWADSIDWRMVEGTGPRVAPKIREITVYASAPFAQSMQVGAYIGAPLLLADGTIYGTLCGLDREEKTKALEDQRRLVDMVAGLLSAIVSREDEGSHAATQITTSEGEVLVDRLTQVFNRRAWDRILTADRKSTRL